MYDFYFEENSVADLLGAIIASGVVVTGWYQTKRYESKKKKKEEQLNYVLKQIEEFYGPLFNLTTQVIHLGAVKNKLAIPPPRQDVEDFFDEFYFTNLHREILKILKTKYHLIKGEVPKGLLEEYMDYSLMYLSQKEMFIKKGIKTHGIVNTGNDHNFNAFINQGLKRAINRRDELLNK